MAANYPEAPNRQEESSSVHEIFRSPIQAMRDLGDRVFRNTPSEKDIEEQRRVAEVRNDLLRLMQTSQDSGDFGLADSYLTVDVPPVLIKQTLLAQATGSY